MKTFCLCLTTMTLLLTSCHSQTSNTKTLSWQEQVSLLDKQIVELMKKDEETRHQANEEERRALIYLKDDWSTYTQKIENVEKDHRTSLEIEKQIKELREKREKIIKANNP